MIPARSFDSSIQAIPWCSWPAGLTGPETVVFEGLCLTDTLVIKTLDRLGRSPQNMLTFADALRSRGAGLRVLNLGGGDVDTATPMGSMFTIMAGPGADGTRDQARTRHGFH